MAFPDENLNTSMSMGTSTDNNLSFPFEPADMSTIFGEASSSFGFMDDLLCVNDYSTPTFFDWNHTCTTDAENPVDNHLLLPSPENINVPGSSEVQQNTPAASPNSFSISSSSNEAAANNKNGKQNGKAEEEQQSGDGSGEGDDQNKDKNEKQNYYRCTTVGCSVKKRVERSPDDFSVVVTTYDGNHNHPRIATSPATHNYMREGGSSALNHFMRASGSGGSSSAINYFMGGGGGSSSGSDGGSIGSQQFLVPKNVQLQQAANLFHQKKVQQAAVTAHQFRQQQNVQQAAAPLFYNSAPPLGNYMNSTMPFGRFVRDQNHGGFGIGPSNRSVQEALLRNDGLLEDIVVPNQMRMRGGGEGLI